MKAVLATFGRELRAYFLSPKSYIVWFLFLGINGLVFATIVSYLSDPRMAGGQPLQPLDLFFTYFWWLLLLAVVPMLTMRLLAEERSTGSIEVLMTAPVTEDQVVLGKYLAALAFYACLWLPTATYALILRSHSEVDWGPVAAGYLGFLLIGAFFLAVGVFASSVTRSQLLAAVLGVVLLAVFLPGAALLEGLFQGTWGEQVLAMINPLAHQDDFAKGIVDSRRLVFYLSGTVFFLFLAGRSLASNKWS